MCKKCPTKVKSTIKKDEGSIDPRIQKKKETSKRRKNKTRKIIHLKINKTKLSKTNQNKINQLFREAKWFYNSIIGSGDVFGFNDKTDEVILKVIKDKENKDDFDIEFKDIRRLSSQMKQAIKQRTIENIKGLSEVKKNGKRVGRLKFKKYIRSIPLKQYGEKGTYLFGLYAKQIRIQNIGWMKVHGLEQFEEYKNQGMEIACANLIRNEDKEYFIDVVIYIDPQPKSIKQKLPSIGIDFGITTALTLSNGLKLDYEVEVSKQIKALSRKLSKAKKCSNNYQKIKSQKRKQYQKSTNQKKDTKDKIRHILKNNFERIVIQDENIKGWMKLFGKKIQKTGLGGLIKDLKDDLITILVDRFFPSTQLCPCCGRKTKHDLSMRIYKCVYCSYTYDRDVKSASCIEQEGLKYIKYVEEELKSNLPMDDREETLAGDKATIYRLLDEFKRIHRLKVSFVVDPRSLL